MYKYFYHDCFSAEELYFIGWYIVRRQCWRLLILVITSAVRKVVIQVADKILCRSNGKSSDAENDCAWCLNLWGSELVVLVVLLITMMKIQRHDIHRFENCGSSNGGNNNNY